MRIFICLVLALFSTICFGQQNKKLIVKFKEGVDYKINYQDRKFTQPLLAGLPAMNKLQQISSLIRTDLTINKNLKRVDLVKNIHFLTLANDADLDIEIKNLLQTGLFEYVEKDAVGTGGGKMITTPDDPAFKNQWGLKNTGTVSTTATVGADIHMEEAWDITTGNANTIVCVLDAGFKMDHPELAGRIWQNTGEIPGNGIDDDGNGYIDDVQGWDWANNDNNPTDDHGHGSNVASIIAAKGANGSVMAGINWNCKLMVGKILDATNSGFYSWWTSGIYYAVDKGAKVINMSVGGSTFSQAMKNACDFAMANNVMIAVCMQNQNTSAPYYPGAYASVIAVGSTSDNDVRTVPFDWDPASGSNYGSHIDLVAPGAKILGLYYLTNTQISYWSGTSQATPHVAGVISLMLGLKPDLTFTQVMNILATTSDDMVGNPAEDVAGWDQYYGYGRLNAKAALDAVLAILPIKFGDITAVRSASGNSVNWTTVSESGLDKFIVEYSTDKMNWMAIGSVAANGNSTTIKSYSLQHEVSDRLEAYYRVKTVDNDGELSYSKIVKVNKNGAGENLSVLSAITSRSNLKINTAAQHKADAALLLYSIDGKLYGKTKQNINTGNGQLTWNINLAAGVYQLVIISEKQKITTGILVN